MQGPFRGRCCDARYPIEYPWLKASSWFPQESRLSGEELQLCDVQTRLI